MLIVKEKFIKASKDYQYSNLETKDIKLYVSSSGKDSFLDNHMKVDGNVKESTNVYVMLPVRKMLITKIRKLNK